MSRHPLKNWLAAATLSAAMIGASAEGSHAFTETKVPPPPVQPTPQTETPKLQMQQPEGGAGLSLTTPGDAKSGGNDLSIPGLGTIGSLPKLDFGLELLYGGGAPSDKPGDEKNDDVLIKGTIKHRF